MRVLRAAIAATLLAAACAVVLVYLATVAARAHFEAPAPTPIVYDRNGLFLAQFGHETPAPNGRARIEYGYWTVETLPPRIVRATLALEDRRFWSHPGVDPRAVLRAAWHDLRGERPRSGASTIAMQVARMQHPAARTLWAKAVEAGTGLALTLRYGRRAVLAQYLRLVPYGNGSHGIGHAARLYFDKPAADLSWAEIALLCAVPQAPAAHNPLRPEGLRRARARASRILDALRGANVLTAAEDRAARAQLAALQPLVLPPRPTVALHAILRLRGILPERLANPSDDRVFSTLDLAVQRQAAAMLDRRLAVWRAEGAQQAAALILRRDGTEVLAAIGSAGWNAPAGGAIDFTRTPRSPGSTLKPFIYAAALGRAALSPAELLEDSATVTQAIGNADARYLGRLPPRQALANSRNVPAADLLRRIGLGPAFDLFRALGLHDLAAAPDNFGLAMAIGALPTRLDRLAQAYAALADDGMLRDLGWYRGQPRPPPRRAFAPAAARQVALFLSDPLARLPSFGRYRSTEYPFPAAVKTGTSQGYRDAWTVAWSDRFLVAAWVGRGDAGPMSALGGADSAADYVHDVMLALHRFRPGDLAEGSFAPPEGAAPATVCAGPLAAPPPCARSLAEWLPPAAAAPAAATDSALRLAITLPAPDSRIWRNPESPPAANRLVLQAQVRPRVAQVVWYVDGAPFALAAPDAPVAWPLTPGEHRFQLGLPLRPERSRPVRVVVE